jgi:hypothetical protein
MSKKKLYNIRKSDFSLVQVEGYDLPNDYGMKLIVHKKLTEREDQDLGWTISDFWTGANVSAQRHYYEKISKKDCIELFHQRMIEYPHAVRDYPNLVEGNVKKYGYANKE